MPTSSAVVNGGMRSSRSRPPGLYVEFRSPAEPLDAGALRGMPAFVALGRPHPATAQRTAVQTFELDYWPPRSNAPDEALPQPAEGSHLGAALQGYFANGGRHCLAVTVHADAPPSVAATAAPEAWVRALTQVFETGSVLDDRSDIHLVCVPDAAHAAIAADCGAVLDIQRAALAHCERMGDRFALLDAWMGDCTDEGALLRHGLAASTELRSAYGALYAPWVLNNPARLANSADAPGAEQWRASGGRTATAGALQPRLVPPCGHIAGLMARLDAQAGPQRAPANLLLDDALDTAAALKPTTRALLNEAGINALHAVRGAGVRVGGARTRSGQPGWLYISTVRVVLEFKRWIAARMADLAFEPNGPGLQAVIRTRLVLHCLALQLSGALAGRDPSEAFFVKCDDETNPPSQQDLGRVIAHVGLAPTLPAEFIVIRVVREANGFDVGRLS